MRGVRIIAGLAIALSSLDEYTNRQLCSVILSVLCVDEFPDPLPQRAQRNTEDPFFGKLWPERPRRPSGESAGAGITSVPTLLTENFHNFSKIFLHLWKFPVISQLRTNFAEMPGNRSHPGAA